MLVRQLLRYSGLFSLLVLVFAPGLVPGVHAQTASQQGEPPVAALISVSQPDETGIVTITGAAGAVFPAATVAIRNLYTGQTVYVAAGITGSFTARLYGPGNTPFWISPAASIPAALRDRPGSLPGGPGTIIYGAPPEPRTQPILTTQILIDADLDDWDAYPAAQVNPNVYALVNSESLYVALQVPVPIGARVALVFTLDSITYEVSLNPRLPQAALARRTTPPERDLGVVAAAAILDEDSNQTEIRVPLNALTSTVSAAALNQVFTRTDGGEELSASVIQATLPVLEERDGILYPGGRMTGNFTRFSVSGALAQGASTWSAAGRAERLVLAPGDSLVIELDLSLEVPDLPAALVGLRLLGEMGLQPVAVDAGASGTATHNIAALLTNNGWSNLLTPSGLALDNVRGDIRLGTASVEPGRIIRRGNTLLAGLRFTLDVPLDLPSGVYVPVFTGYAQVGDGEVFAWTENNIFGRGPGVIQLPLTRLPITLNIGGVREARLPWALFYDHPSDGSRGILPDEDAGRIALSNRVRYNSATYILPPGIYPLEPYLPNLLPNAYSSNAAPLLTLLFPGGRLNATVTGPDGLADELPSTAIVQNRLSTDTLDERTRFGAQSPLDVYRLSTLNSAFSAYNFDQYGEYEIRLSGNIEDIWGMRYAGGGTYRLLVAELLDLTPGVLPGTPFQVGDAFYAGAQIAPGFPADVTVRVRLFPLDGGDVIEQEISGRANRYGVFIPGAEEDVIFDQPGEYIIDYEARYQGADGRLWAASQRSAGIVASVDGAVSARGRRGLSAYEANPQAWFTTLRYPFDGTQAAPQPNYPYHSGDVAVVPDSAGGIRPVLQAYDGSGAYGDWLLATVPGAVTASGESIERAINRGSLPLLPILGGPERPYGPALLPDFIVNEAYGYISAVRPGVTVRQFVQGVDDLALPVQWDNDDPLNSQIGAGLRGSRPGDYVFLFGGIVIRNFEAGLQDAAAYAALAVVGEADAPARTTPPYRGAAGGPSSGPLLTIRGEEIDIFFHPTSLRPGQVMTVGERLAFAGQVGPTLTSAVTVRVTAPDGSARRFDGLTNPTGYYYDPEASVSANQPGVWIIEITATPAGTTSAGEPQPPLPRGGVPGAVSRRFEVYAVPATSAPLEWNRGGDVESAIPPGVPFNFTLTIPAGWRETRAYRSVTMPGYVLESGALTIPGSTLSYQYSPAGLNRIVPGLEFDGAGGGAAASDVVTLTFTVTGIDGDGNFAVRTRTFYILHDRLLSFDTLAGDR